MPYTPRLRFNNIVTMKQFSSAPEKVKFIIKKVNKDKEYVVEGEVGQNMLKAGLEAKVPFQVACGGNGECCTCHVFLNDNIIKA